MAEREKLTGDEVVIHVPKGAAKNVRVEETDEEHANHITVRVSKTRTASKVPVLGVIVK